MHLRDDNLKYKPLLFIIMAKEDLDQDGIDNNLQDLYDLSDSLLNVEAAAIQTDFMGWLDDNFNVTVDQETFLLGIHVKARTYLADMCSIAVKNRIQINYEPLPDTPANAQLRASKRVDVTNNIFTSFDVTGGTPVFTGSLDIVAAI